MGKRKIDIIYRGDIRQVQGINYVIDSFVKGSSFWGKHNLELNRIFSPVMIIDVAADEDMPIGSNLNTIQYKTNRRVRVLLHKMMDSRFSFFAWIKFYLNMLKPAKSIVKKYIEVGKSDYIVFQDVFSAYYYYTNKHINHSKSILILHIGENLYTQLEEEFPGIFKSKKLRRKFEMIVNFGLNRVNKIVYISRRAMNASHLPDKSDFVYNGVPDFPFIYPKFIGFPINIITVGSINGHKGQEIIVESISLMDKKDRTKIHVYFVGGGLLEKTLKLRCEVLGISDTITFMGVRNDVAELLKNMHLFILPSISEGLPMSIIEALRQGLYIMTTDTGGTQEMIGNGFGEIINRDPQMIKDAICDLIVNNKINLDSMINARKHYEENFRLESMINKYAEIINSL